MGALELLFLQSKETTGSSLDMFEMTLQPNARMPVPHYHESWDEAVYGLAGTATFRVGAEEVELPPGCSLFIGRGIIHGFDNRSGAPARCLVVLTQVFWVLPTSGRSPNWPPPERPTRRA